MSKIAQVRLLRERALGPLEMPSPPPGRGVAPRPARSVTVNLAESPLGWLFSRGLLSKLQYDAGERLRSDWERSQLAPNVTMSWDAAPIARGRGGSSAGADLSAGQLDARQRFEAAVASAGPGLSDILWRVVCAGEGMRDAETALGWTARAGRLVLTLALDRLALYYRMG
jgi:hypothetical protein